MIERIFKANHPAVQGHFPGNPIVPGAVLLSEVILAIEGLEGIAPLRIASAKFLRPTLPGDRVLIDFSRRARGTVDFRCSVEGALVLTGRLSCRALLKAI